MVEVTIGRRYTMSVESNRKHDIIVLTDCGVLLATLTLQHDNEDREEFISYLPSVYSSVAFKCIMLLKHVCEEK